MLICVETPAIGSFEWKPAQEISSVYELLSAADRELLLRNMTKWIQSFLLAIVTSYGHKRRIAYLDEETKKLWKELGDDIPHYGNFDWIQSQVTQNSIDRMNPETAIHAEAWLKDHVKIFLITIMFSLDSETKVKNMEDLLVDLLNSGLDS